MYEPPRYGCEYTDDEDDSILGSQIPDLTVIGNKKMGPPTGFLSDLDIASDHDYETDFQLLVSFALQYR